MDPTNSAAWQHLRGAAKGQHDPTTPSHLLASAFAFWPSALLLQAHELGLFVELTHGPRDAATLSQRLGLDPDTGGDFLDALVELGLLECSEDLYRNAAEVERFLDPAKPAYIGRWFAMASAALRETIHLSEHLRTADSGKDRQPSLADRMWADIADILGTAGAKE